MSFTNEKLSEIATNYVNIHKNAGIALSGNEWW